jgi:CHAT domain-containing protein
MEALDEINCLVIKADVHGWEKESGIELEKSANISKEADQLTARLKELERNHVIGECRSIPENGTECTREEVEETLKCGKQWHLVHYAGHSHSTAEDNGYVFFSRSDRPDPVDIRLFAQWLRQAKTRFVYLSSCQSSKLRFVHELAQKAVPAVIGYRWDIDDDKAAEHADIFYDHLFREQSLEYAFLKTRQQASERWAFSR